ncbi:MAG: hypothetical protein H7263_13120 [Candidatus Sericytochromatia bacterium]|nr:hypothetical protein [Candidatus Sericytochromatia bacterium]
MIKRLLVTLVAFVTVFLTQSQAWAAVNNADKIAETINVSIDKSTFLASDEAPAVISKRMAMGDGGASSYVWLASIFIAGLGQILMGDLWRGLKFTIIVYGLGIIWSVIAGVLIGGAATSGNYGLVSTISYVGYAVYLVIIAAYIYNIIDSYNMSQETAGMSKLNSQELAKLERDLRATVDFVQSTKVSNNGTVSVRALTF